MRNTHLGGRLSLAFAAGLLAAGLSLPALAVDTGGGGGEPAAPAMSAPAPSTSPAPRATRPTQAPRARRIDLNEARQLIARNDWNGSVKLLRQIVVQQPRNADALNLLGYSLRQQGKMKEAEAWYLKALKLKPGHLGANEYLGELYVMTGQMSKAQSRLKVIARICGNTSCEEYQDLAKAIATKA
ncbi:MAG TPA: tetratricopeptide repeat protein [Devosiaceae bacterium]|jgi:tetratricopeptide (TPR) repeat protein|nr:tetratricopeptide repeat protein [Devosiaceae bacterium]